MKNNYIFKHLSEIKFVNTSHQSGKKKVFITQNNSKSQIMQAAKGYLNAGEKIEEHLHHSMEEFYFFESGIVNFFIDNKEIKCKKGTFIMVPEKCNHFMEALTKTTFIYWGVAF